MKMYTKIINSSMVLFFCVLLWSCTNSEYDKANQQDPEKACSIHLYDNDELSGESLVIDQPGDYPNLDNLPGADGKNWTDEADSFKVGEGAVVTIWTARNFEGDSTVYTAGEYPGAKEPSSLKIECSKESAK